MTKKITQKNVVIIGGGPAGLAVAYEILKKKNPNFTVLILESQDQVGGLSKTLYFKGFRFDLGGHRFYTKYSEITQFYDKYLGKDMLVRKRLSRIFYKSKFYNYPLSAFNAVSNLGIINAVGILISWAKRQISPYKNEKNFQEWVSNRFGDRLFRLFFKSYSEKVWGIPTTKLSADWAHQRIQNFNLLKAVVNALLKIDVQSKTLITHFYYPKQGPGMLYEKMLRQIVKKGGRILLNTEVVEFKKKNENIKSVTVLDSKQNRKEINGDIFVSTMPFDQLIGRLTDDSKYQKIIKKLKFRNFISVNLVVRNNPFPDQWIYIHDPDVLVGRIQNFRNWSPFMAKKNSNFTPIGMEYFASEGDKLWRMSNKDLLSLAKKEIIKIGLVTEDDIIDGFVYRVHNAYPIYNFNYQKPLEQCKELIKNYHNLHLCGRGGLFRYNNQDHSILTGFYVGRNILANKILFDVWSVNDEKKYIESTSE